MVDFLFLVVVDGEESVVVDSSSSDEMKGETREANSE